MPYGDYVELLGDDNEDRYERALAALEEDEDNAYGPKHGGYSLALRFVESFYPPYVEADEGPKTDEEVEADRAARLISVAETLELLDADLVTVRPEEARWWGENGTLAALKPFQRRRGV